MNLFHHFHKASFKSSFRNIPLIFNFMTLHANIIMLLLLWGMHKLLLNSKCAFASDFFHEAKGAASSHWGCHKCKKHLHLVLSTPWTLTTLITLKILGNFYEAVWKKVSISSVCSLFKLFVMYLDCYLGLTGEFFFYSDLYPALNLFLMEVTWTLKTIYSHINYIQGKQTFSLTWSVSLWSPQFTAYGHMWQQAELDSLKHSAFSKFAV